MKQWLDDFAQIPVCRIQDTFVEIPCNIGNKQSTGKCKWFPQEFESMQWDFHDIPKE